MKTYRNIHFAERDCEATNVVYCEAGQAPNDNWIEADIPIHTNMRMLWVENGVRYYGHL